ncbi:hypothetical protein C8Q74DRAFT_1223971 [Fomes fomentarius]|nr:hypothetical protein C8Q74DRAFT_1223971 [Fomes fomentarius]
MAYLVRRRETHLIRLLLLPTVLATTVWCTFGYKSLDPRMAWYEWVRGLFALFVIAKSLDYAFATEGRRRLGESGPLPLIHEPEPDPASRSRPTSAGVWVPRPPSALPAQRSAFINSTVRRIVRNQLYVDLFDTIGKLTPGQYALSTCLHLGHGLLIIAGVELVYDYLSLAGVVLLGQSPGAGWHQALRYPFLTLGGFPGCWLAGGPGMVFGTFLASGLFHEIGITVAGRDVDHRVTRAFRRVTGRRVGGVLGTVRAMIFVLGFGQMCTDAWFARGIGGAWWRPLLLPILRRLGITP